MEKVIPWDTGGGNIRLSFTGQGNGTITATSDTDNFTGSPREKTVSVQTTKGGSVVLSLIIRQESESAFCDKLGIVIAGRDGIVFAGKEA